MAQIPVRDIDLQNSEFLGYLNDYKDVLLKRDFDKYRGAETTHEFLINLDMGHLIPFEHLNF